MDAPLQCFGMEQDSLKKDDGVGLRDMMKCGIDGGAQMENGHEKKPNEKYGRDKTEV